MISAVILAAGSSFRMGRPKALLTYHSISFVQHIAGISEEAGAGEVVIVLGADAEVIGKELGWFRGILAVNKGWTKGQLGSIICGLDAISKNADGAMVWPVDHPAVSALAIKDLIQAAAINAGKIIVPVYGKRRGHPVIFPSVLFGEIRKAPADVGARFVVGAHSRDVVEVRTLEPGVVLNIDTPETYGAL